MIIELRALIGDWEGERPMFLGAVEMSQYRAIREQDDRDGTERWQALCKHWIEEGAMGIIDTREVDIRLPITDDFFDVPKLTGKVESAE